MSTKRKSHGERKAKAKQGRLDAAIKAAQRLGYVVTPSKPKDG